MKLSKRQIISLVSLVLWMVVIFLFSCQKAEDSDKTSGIVVKLVETITNNKISTDTINLNHIVRKIAHFTEYAILGILMINALKAYNIKKYLLLTIIFSSLYAISDEFHQLFSFGRSSQVSDVLIDVCGIICGVLLYKGVYLIYEKKKKNQKE